jgi:hypothetical protein
MIWKLIARARGWQEARDAENFGLVVFHDQKPIHYTGDDAWKFAALHRGAVGTPAIALLFAFELAKVVFVIVFIAVLFVGVVICGRRS